MVEVGELEIAGTMNTAEIDAGLNRIRTSLEKTSDATKPVQADMERITKGVSRSSLAFVGLGVAGFTALKGLSQDAPALAGAFSRIDVATGQIKRSLGREFQDTAENIANIFDRIAGAIQSAEGSDLIKTAGAAGTGALVGGIIGSIIPGAGTVAGAGIGGALTAGVSTRVQDITSGKPTDILGLTGQTQRMGLGGILGSIFTREDRKLNMFSWWDQVFG